MTQRRILLFTLFMTLVFNAAYGGIELRSKQMRTSTDFRITQFGTCIRIAKASCGWLP